MMYKILHYLKFLMSLNLNTIRFNFKYFDFKTAIKFPVVVSSNVYLKKLLGRVVLDFDWYSGSVLLGYGEIGIFDKKNSRSIWELNSGTIIFEGKADIGHGFKISVNNGILNFGDNFKISAESSLVCKDAEINFGKNNLLSWDIIMMTSDLHAIFNERGDRINMPQNIILGDNVWIGCRSTILKGSTIPSGCIIAANSLINKQFTTDNTIIGGNPCKVLKKQVFWK